MLDCQGCLFWPSILFPCTFSLASCILPTLSVHHQFCSIFGENVHLNFYWLIPPSVWEINTSITHYSSAAKQIFHRYKSGVWKNTPEYFLRDFLMLLISAQTMPLHGLFSFDMLNLRFHIIFSWLGACEGSALCLLRPDTPHSTKTGGKRAMPCCHGARQKELCLLELMNLEEDCSP